MDVEGNRFLTSIGNIVSYQLKSSIGQVVFDNSGNALHAVLGATLLEDDHDPILTDRGAYFQGVDYIALPPNALLPQARLTLSNFYAVIFIYLISQGTVFSIYKSTTQIMSLSFSSNAFSLYFKDTLGNKYATIAVSSNTWLPVIVILNLLTFGDCLTELMSIKVVSKETTFIISTFNPTSLYHLKIGDSLSSFTGFISEFQMFTSTNCFSAYDVHNNPVFPEGNQDPLVSNTGQSCNCGSYSCTGSSLYCVECDSSCDLACSGILSSDCLDIIEMCKPYAIIQGICDTSVLYINHCKKQQSSLICLQCDSGYILGSDSSVCCSSGFFGSSTIPCTACDPSCSECFGPDNSNCLSCIDPSALVISGSCTCQLGVDSLTGLCLGCKKECETCSSLSSCTTCKDPRSNLDINSQCLCPSGFFMQTSGYCVSCDVKCSTCSGGLSSECLTCSDPNAELVSAFCTCKTFYFYNENSGICEPCSLSCSSCQDNLLCTACKDLNSELDSVPGVCRCKSRFFDNGINEVLCVLCHLDCLRCFGPGQDSCIECFDFNAEVIYGSGICQCKNGWLKQGENPFSCVPCHSSCKTCTTTSINGCTSCTDILAVVIDGKCVCPSGYYLSFSCEPCSITCLTCTGPSPSECQSCSDPSLSLKDSICSCNISNYFNNTSKKCEKCAAPCKSCQNLSECSECLDSFELVSNNCICKSGTYLVPQLLSCESCHSSCNSCFGGEISNCLSCKDESITPLQGYCTCAIGFYLLSRNPLTCEKCHQDCLECRGPNNSDCLQCRDQNSALEENFCVCVEGFFRDEKFSCSPCHYSCLSCKYSGYGGCLTCRSGAFLAQDGRCVDCIDYCQVCAEINKCIECRIGFYLSDGICHVCNENCLTCSQSGPEYCLSCLNQTIKPSSIPGRCSCPFREFMIKSDPITCEKCSDFCESCDKSECFKCSKGFSPSGVKCEVKVFFLDLEVLGNNSIFLKFSEKLEKELEINEIQVIDSVKNQRKFNLSFLTEKEYRVDIDDLKQDSKDQNFYLKFENPVFSEGESILSKLEYSFKIKAVISPVLGYAEVIKKILVNSVVFSGVASVIFNSNNPYIWVTINTIQILSYSPLINIKLTKILNSFLMGLRPLSLLQVDWITSRFFYCETKSINPKFYDYGFTCRHFLNNSVELIISFIGGLIFFILLAFLKLIPIPKLSHLIDKKLKSYKYAFFVRFWIQGFIELLIPSVISINYLSLSSPNNAINTIVAIFLTALTLITPVLVFTFYRTLNYKIRQNNEELFMKYSPLLDEFNTNSCLQIFYPVSFVVKITYVYSWYFLYEFPWYQVAVCAFLPIFNIFLVKISKVFKDKGTERMFIFYEIIIFVVFTLLGMLLFDENSKYEDYIGYTTIAVVIFGIIVGTFVSLVEFIKSIKKLCQNTMNDKKINDIESNKPDKVKNDLCHSIKKIEEINFIQVVPFNSNYQSANHSMNLET